MSKRCPVCDSPVVGGRCRSCGMLYRSDEELYHLNENKSDHYAHASAKARKIMDRNEVPLPDRRAMMPGGRAASRYGTSASYGKKTASPGDGNKKARSSGTKIATWIWGGIVLLYIIISFLTD